MKSPSNMKDTRFRQGQIGIVLQTAEINVGPPPNFRAILVAMQVLLSSGDGRHMVALFLRHRALFDERDPCLQ
jgi:hypothetical protein